MVLPQDIYLKSLGLLIDTFISTLIQFILKCPSITDDFAHQIRYALNLTSKMNHWYAFPIKSGKKRKGGESEGHQIQVFFFLSNFNFILYLTFSFRFNFQLLLFFLFLDLSIYYFNLLNFFIFFFFSFFPFFFEWGYIDSISTICSII